MLNKDQHKSSPGSRRQKPFGSRTSLTNRPMLVWGILVGYCALVFVGSSISQVPQELGKIPDYVLHFIEYFIMGLLANLAFRSRPLSFRIGMASVIATLFCVAYAVSDEFHQYFVRGRYASLPDIGADLLGAASAQIAILLCNGFRTSRKRNKR